MQCEKELWEKPENEQAMRFLPGTSSYTRIRALVARAYWYTNGPMTSVMKMNIKPNFCVVFNVVTALIL
jgi:hypothetical protein